jgi:copper homeostasis protein
MRKIIFELCAETISACLAAQHGGAARIELCSGLSEGGLTPSHALIGEAIRLGSLPVHVLIRPRGGSYVHSDGEVAVMAEDIRHAKSLGAAGVVLGLLRTDGVVDVEGTRRLVELARPMDVTFHRAFDSTPSLPDALESVIETGCRRVLTSGGQPNALKGADMLAALVAQAAGRIEIAVGGGLRLQNAATLARLTGATHFHGSLQTRQSRRQLAVPPGTDRGHTPLVDRVDPENVRRVVQRLRTA